MGSTPDTSNSIMLCCVYNYVINKIEFIQNTKELSPNIPYNELNMATENLNMADSQIKLSTEEREQNPMAITIERNAINGSYTASALVEDNYTPFAWYESHTYYGYAKAEIKSLFKQDLAQKNLRIVKGN